MGRVPAERGSGGASVSRVDGPVSVTVAIETEIDAVTKIRFESEFVVTDPDEAREKGEQFHELQTSWLLGYAAAAEDD